MPGVKHDQAHALPDASLDAIHNRVLHLAVGGMPPPGEHVRGGQRFLAQAMFGLLKRGGADFKFIGFAQPVGNAPVHGLRVSGANRLVFLFVNVFTPDGDADW